MAENNQGKEPEPGTNDQELDKINMLKELNNMVLRAAVEIEGRLGDRLDAAIASINTNIEANAAAVSQIQGQAKVALETVPNLIQNQIQDQLQANLKGIIDQVSNTFEEKVKEMAGDFAGSNGGGLTLDRLLNNSDKIIGVINAFRSPTTEQAMMSQMSFVMRWHQLLSKIEKGGGSGEDVTKAITDTFNREEQ